MAERGEKPIEDFGCAASPYLESLWRRPSWMPSINVSEPAKAERRSMSCNARASLVGQLDRICFARRSLSPTAVLLASRWRIRASCASLSPSIYRPSSESSDERSAVGHRVTSHQLCEPNLLPCNRGAAIGMVSLRTAACRRMGV